jgi:hypothetical protein
MFEIEVEITWRMLQIEVSQDCYVGVPICSDMSVNSTFRFTMINKNIMLELYYNSKPRLENSYSMELNGFQVTHRESHGHHELLVHLC